MERKGKSTKVEPKQRNREEQSKQASQERNELVEQLKLLNYNLLSIGMILGGSLGVLACNTAQPNATTDKFIKNMCDNITKMKEVNSKMGITEEV